MRFSNLTMGEFEQIPTEIIFNIIQLHDGKDLLNFCSSNKTIRDICHNEYIWKQKVNQIQKIDDPGILSWKTVYINLKNILPLYVFIGATNSGQIFVTYDDTIESVIQLANTKLSLNTNTYPILAILRAKNGSILASISQPLSPNRRFFKLPGHFQLKKITVEISSIEYLYEESLNLEIF